MSRSDRVLVASGAGALVLAIAAATVLLLPADARPAGEAGDLLVPSIAQPASQGPAPSTSPTTIVVDVSGAVSRPGLLDLAAGARIGDAIAAAGGYAADADLDAAAATLNLAQRLSDGEQIRVPRVGEAAAERRDPAATKGATGTPPQAGGLVNLNTATPEELEALPGIGPVTVQKIVAARQERPFASLEDAVTRGVIHRGQLEDIREHATAG